jgi:hypothetical protein
LSQILFAASSKFCWNRIRKDGNKYLFFYISHILLIFATKGASSIKCFGLIKVSIQPETGVCLFDLMQIGKKPTELRQKKVHVYFKVSHQYEE